jgi:multiple sugar transport system permease protein
MAAKHLRRFAFVVIALLGIGATARASDVTLRFADFDHPEAVETLQSCINSFQAANPGIKVVLEDNYDYNSYFSLLFAEGAAYVGPDVAMVDPSNYERFASRGMLTPLNQFFCDVNGFDINAYYPEMINAFTYNGKLYVLPRDTAPQGLIYYNKKAFIEAGIPFPDGRWTWDFGERPALKTRDFLWVVHHLTKYDADGKVVRFGFVPDSETLFTDTLVYSEGLSYIDDVNHITELRYSDPRVVKTYDFVAHVYTSLGYIPTGMQVGALFSTPHQLFEEGRAAMYQCGIWEVKDIRDYMKKHPEQAFDWDITLAPGFKTGQQAWPSGGSGYAMMSSTQHPREAWKLITWMAGPPGMTALAKSGIAQPAIKSLARSEPWVPGPDTPPEERVPASRILTDTAVSHSVFDIRDENWSEIKNLIYDHQGHINDGSEPAQVGLQAVQDDGVHRLRDILRDEAEPKFNWWCGGFFMAALLCSLIGWVVQPRRNQLVSKRQKAENRIAFGFLSPWIIGLAIFVVGPVLLSLVMGFTSWDYVSPARWRGFGNYAEMCIQDPRFWPSLQVTLGYLLLSVPFSTALALVMALLLDKRPKGAWLFRTCFVLPVLASPVAITLIWRQLFQPEGGMFNAVVYGPDGQRNLFGLGSLVSQLTSSPKPGDWLGSDKLYVIAFAIMSLLSVGTAIIVLHAGLQSIPSDLKDAAKLEGAGPWRKLRNLTFPILAPYVFFLVLSGVVGGFQLFTQPYVVMNSTYGDSRFFSYFVYEDTFRSFRVGYGAALTWVLFLITGSFALLQLRLNRHIYYEADR